MRQRNQGDREHAIHLLKTTTLKYKDISKETGVPNGTINGLALVHRPSEVRNANRRKAGVENLLTAHEKREHQSGTATQAQVQQKEDVPVPVATSPRGLLRTMLFSYEAKTDVSISKAEALEEIAHLKQMIHSATGRDFNFNITVSAKEGA